MRIMGTLVESSLHLSNLKENDMPKGMGYGSKSGGMKSGGMKSNKSGASKSKSGGMKKGKK
jgi:hypothetical protein